MHTAWLILLLPLAAASGWWLGARWLKEQKSSDFEASCIGGIKQLLSLEDDEALDAFLKAIDEQPKSVELQMVLGNLCRRKGEYERASLMHLSILNHQSHDNEIREQAKYELALDYQAAGWLDRAESLYVDLLESAHYQCDTAYSLLKIYHQQKDWTGAIQTTKLLLDLGDVSDADYFGECLVHFYCELCEQKISEGQFPAAEKALNSADKLQPAHPRVLILSARLATFKGKSDLAITLWNKLALVAPAHIGAAIIHIQDSFKLSQDETTYKAFLKNAVSISHDPKLLVALLDVLKTDKELNTGQFLLQHLKDNPSVEGLKHVLLNWKDLPHKVNTEELMFLVDMMAELLKEEGRFQCQECGFKAQSFEWSCPGCLKWGSYKLNPLNSKLANKLRKGAVQHHDVVGHSADNLGKPASNKIIEH